MWLSARACRTNYKPLVCVCMYGFCTDEGSWEQLLNRSCPEDSLEKRTKMLEIWGDSWHFLLVTCWWKSMDKGHPHWETPLHVDLLNTFYINSLVSNATSVKHWKVRQAQHTECHNPSHEHEEYQRPLQKTKKIPILLCCICVLCYKRKCTNFIFYMFMKGPVQYT